MCVHESGCRCECIVDMDLQSFERTASAGQVTRIRDSESAVQVMHAAVALKVRAACSQGVRVLRVTQTLSPGVKLGLDPQPLLLLSVSAHSPLPLTPRTWIIAT